MKKVYIVTSGSYSDYRINCVFETRETAEHYTNGAHEDDQSDITIEEWELGLQDNQYQKIYTVYLDLTTGSLIDQRSYEHWQQVPRDYSISNVLTYTSPSSPSVAFAASAVSKEHAIKVAVERRQEHLRETGMKIIST